MPNEDEVYRSGSNEAAMGAEVDQLLRRRLQEAKKAAPTIGAGRYPPYPNDVPPDTYTPMTTGERASLYRGEASCASRVIFGEAASNGVRVGRLVIEEVPSREAIRLRIVGADDGDLLLDAAGYDALKDAFSSYTNKTVNRPDRKDISDQITEAFAVLEDALGKTLPDAERKGIERALDAYRNSFQNPNGRRRMDLSDEPPAPGTPIDAEVPQTDSDYLDAAEFGTFRDADKPA